MVKIFNFFHQKLYIMILMIILLGIKIIKGFKVEIRYKLCNTIMMKRCHLDFVIYSVKCCYILHSLIIMAGKY